MRKWVWLVRKEALAEARALERIPTLVLFASLLLLTLRFALPAEARDRGYAGAGFCFAVVVFAALLELRRSFDDERRSGALDGLRAAPLDPAILLGAKVTSALAVLAVLEVLLVCATALLFGGRASGIPASVGVLVLGSVGLLAWGTLFAAATVHTRSGDAVLALLLFPLLVPQTIASVRLVAHYLGGAPLDDPATGFVLLAAFDALSAGTAILLFEYVLGE